MTEQETNAETLGHIMEVRARLDEVVVEFMRRGREHDKSKLSSPEVEMFTEFTPKLRASTYGSDEYKGFCTAMGPALRHHYDCNSHHPEHYSDGVRGMDLFDVIEMLADWYAAGKRHSNGDLRKSIEINRKRFNLSDEFVGLLTRTATRLGWIAES